MSGAGEEGGAGGRRTSPASGDGGYDPPATPSATLATGLLRGTPTQPLAHLADAASSSGGGSFLTRVGSSPALGSRRLLGTAAASASQVWMESSHSTLSGASAASLTLQESAPVPYARRHFRRPTELIDDAAAVASPLASARRALAADEGADASPAPVPAGSPMLTRVRSSSRLQRAGAQSGVSDLYVHSMRESADTLQLRTPTSSVASSAGPGGCSTPSPTAAATAAVVATHALPDAGPARLDASPVRPRPAPIRLEAVDEPSSDSPSSDLHSRSSALPIVVEPSGASARTSMSVAGIAVADGASGVDDVSTSSLHYSTRSETSHQHDYTPQHATRLPGQTNASPAFGQPGIAAGFVLARAPSRLAMHAGAGVTLDAGAPGATPVAGGIAMNAVPARGSARSSLDDVTSSTMPSLPVGSSLGDSDMGSPTGRPVATTTAPVPAPQRAPPFASRIAATNDLPRLPIQRAGAAAGLGVDQQDRGAAMPPSDSPTCTPNVHAYGSSELAFDARTEAVQQSRAVSMGGPAGMQSSSSAYGDEPEVAWNFSGSPNPLSAPKLTPLSAATRGMTAIGTTSMDGVTGIASSLADLSTPMTADGSGSPLAPPPATPPLELSVSRIGGSRMSTPTNSEQRRGFGNDTSLALSTSTSSLPRPASQTRIRGASNLRLDMSETAGGAYVPVLHSVASRKTLLAATHSHAGEESHTRSSPASLHSLSPGMRMSRMSTHGVHIGPLPSPAGSASRTKRPSFAFFPSQDEEDLLAAAAAANARSRRQYVTRCVGWSREAWQTSIERCHQLIDTNAFNVFMCLATLLSLFLADIQVGFLDKSADTACITLLLACVALMVFEFVVQVITRPRYRFNFYFWMELLCITSFLTDFNATFMPMSSSFYVQHIASPAAPGYVDLPGSDARVYYARTAEFIFFMWRVGRLFRFVRIIKLYKALKKALIGCCLPAALRAGMARKAGDHDAGEDAAGAGVPAPKMSHLMASLGGVSGFDAGISRRFQNNTTSPAAAAASSLRLRARRTSMYVEPSGHAPAGGPGGSMFFDASARAAGTSVTVTGAGTYKPIQMIGTKLPDLTTRRVLLSVIIVAFFSPFFNYSAVEDDPHNVMHQMQLHWLHRRPQDLNVTQAQFKQEVQTAVVNAKGAVLALYLCDSAEQPTQCAHPPNATAVSEWVRQAAAHVRVLNEMGQLSDATVTDEDAEYDPVAVYDVSPATHDLRFRSLTDVALNMRIMRYRFFEAVGCFDAATDAGAPSPSGVAAPLPNVWTLASRRRQNLLSSRYLVSDAQRACLSWMVVDVSAAVQRDALLAIGRTILLVFLIGLFVAIFTRDAHALVLRHIERMVALMRALRDNPLEPLDVLYERLKAKGSGAAAGGVTSPAGGSGGVRTPSAKFVAAVRSRRMCARGKLRSWCCACCGGRSSTSTVATDAQGSPISTTSARAHSTRNNSLDAGVQPVGASAYLLPPTAAGNSGAGTLSPLTVGSTSLMADGGAFNVATLYRSGSGVAPATTPRIPRVLVVVGSGSAASMTGTVSGATSGGGGGGGHRQSIVSSPSLMPFADLQSSAGGTAAASHSAMTSTAITRLSSAHYIGRGAGGGVGGVGGMGGTASPTLRTSPQQHRRVRRCAHTRAWCHKAADIVGQRVGDGALWLSRKLFSWLFTSHDESDTYETQLLEETIIKVGGLLQVALGEAGREIIMKNMTGKGMLQPLSTGTKVNAVFGFCDVRQFTDVTECLQTDVLAYVNTIGRIVHSATYRFNGAPNKNIGDAFLLVWKVPKMKRKLDSLDTRGSVKNRQIMKRKTARTSSFFSWSRSGAQLADAGNGGAGSGVAHKPSHSDVMMAGTEEPRRRGSATALSSTVETQSSVGASVGGGGAAEPPSSRRWRSGSLVSSHDGGLVSVRSNKPWPWTSSFLSRNSSQRAGSELPGVGFGMRRNSSSGMLEEPLEREASGGSGSPNAPRARIGAAASAHGVALLRSGSGGSAGAHVLHGRNASAPSIVLASVADELQREEAAAAAHGSAGAHPTHAHPLAASQSVVSDGVPSPSSGLNVSPLSLLPGEVLSSPPASSAAPDQAASGYAPSPGVSRRQSLLSRLSRLNVAVPAGSAAAVAAAAAAAAATENGGTPSAASDAPNSARPTLLYSSSNHESLQTGPGSMSAIGVAGPSTHGSTVSSTRTAGARDRRWSDSGLVGARGSGETTTAPAPRLLRAGSGMDADLSVNPHAADATTSPDTAAERGVAFSRARWALDGNGRRTSGPRRSLDGGLPRHGSPLMTGAAHDSFNTSGSTMAGAAPSPLLFSSSQVSAEGTGGTPMQGRLPRLSDGELNAIPVSPVFSDFSLGSPVAVIPGGDASFYRSNGHTNGGGGGGGGGDSVTGSAPSPSPLAMAARAPAAPQTQRRRSSLRMSNAGSANASPVGDYVAVPMTSGDLLHGPSPLSPLGGGALAGARGARRSSLGLRVAIAPMASSEEGTPPAPGGAEPVRRRRGSAVPAGNSLGTDDSGATSRSALATAAAASQQSMRAPSGLSISAPVTHDGSPVQTGVGGSPATRSVRLPRRSVSERRKSNTSTSSAASPGAQGAPSTPGGTRQRRPTLSSQLTSAAARMLQSFRIGSAEDGAGDAQEPVAPRSRRGRAGPNIFFPSAAPSTPAVGTPGLSYATSYANLVADPRVLLSGRDDQGRFLPMTVRANRQSAVMIDLGPKNAPTLVPKMDLTTTDTRKVRQLADNALGAFLKVLVDLHRAERNPLKDGPDLRVFQQRLMREARFANGYSVHMGFGLHIGWAIEGPIGSKYKIDASYLSPHVNLASRLEAATKQYGVDLLLSHDFATQCSEEVQRKLRLLDIVRLKGSQEAMKIYTFDIFNMPETFGEDAALNWDTQVESSSSDPKRRSQKEAADKLFFQGSSEEGAADSDAAGGAAQGAPDGREALPGEESGIGGADAAAGEESGPVPPQDFKIKVDFDTDPAIIAMQTISRTTPGWSFPDDSIIVASYRANKMGPSAPPVRCVTVRIKDSVSNMTPLASVHMHPTMDSLNDVTAAGFSSPHGAGASAGASAGAGTGAPRASALETTDTLGVGDSSRVLAETHESATPAVVAQTGTDELDDAEVGVTDDGEFVHIRTGIVLLDPDELVEAEVYYCKRLVEEFFSQFHAGVVSYIEGDWSTARAHLGMVQQIKPDDGPTATLLRAMDELCPTGPGTNGPAPADWGNCRNLTEK